ncbi:MAG: LysR family transcriptional regulator [Cycloclasticus sp. symbiont of Bathymodiolus heckerae]|nr:MAG: LysR family transcriptional regulator [Cycloclasticus sp. symbiont of Bathymodiolus heckerae]
MSKIDDMELFVQVVKANGLAAAGRKIGLSPASMTARINLLEQRYNTRLLNRTTRKISLTDAGYRFYNACLRVISEVEDAEALLQGDNKVLSGQLRITAPFDFGEVYVAPALQKFTSLHPGVLPYLYLSDGVTNLVEHGFDLGVRFGNLPDSNLVVHRLADNHRVLVASPGYLKKHGIPKKPTDLNQHCCLVMARLGEPLNEWRFHHNDKEIVIKASPSFISNSGAIIRQWALAGVGISYKSIWDVKHDLAQGNLETILDDFVLGFQRGDNANTGLQLVYPSRHYLPRQVAEFIRFFKTYISSYS